MSSVDPDMTGAVDANAAPDGPDESQHTGDVSSPAEADADTHSAPPGADVDELAVALEAITSERDSHLADLQRITAEFANFRRQASKRQSDVVEHAAASLAEKLLPVLDACDSALSQGASDVGPILGVLLDVLTREGLEVVADAATAFDPELHEAVMHEPSEQEAEPVVSEVMRAGYVWKGKVLRPAMVRVRG